MKVEHIWMVKRGHAIHDDDCWFDRVGICTCGLLQALQYAFKRSEIYPTYDQERAQHDQTLTGLAAQRQIAR